MIDIIDPRPTEKLKEFVAPFPMKCAVDEQIRQAQMAVCVRQRLPRLRPRPIDETASISIACYGPSLADTYQALTRPIISMSGSHNFLIERGIVPDYHVDMDPRPTKLAHILTPHPQVQYLMASVCHPFTWSLLRGCRVQTFHVVSGANTYAWLQMYDPQSLLVIAGSSIGLGAIHISGMLGYRHVEIHGMDGCYRDNERHAGQHFGHHQAPIPWTANGHTWQTSKIMQNSNVELLSMLHTYPFFVVLHGRGLMQDMVIDADPPNAAVAGTAKAEAIRTARIEIVPTETEPTTAHGASQRA